MNENVIEFLRNEERATVTFSQGRFIHKIEKLAQENPDKCQIIKKNNDGSILAHIPTSWIRIRPPRKIDMDEEQKEQLRNRFISNIRKE